MQSIVNKNGRILLLLLLNSQLSLKNILKNLPTYLPFPVLSIFLCRFRFLSGIIFLLPEKLPLTIAQQLEEEKWKYSAIRFLHFT